MVGCVYRLGIDDHRIDRKPKEQRLIYLFSISKNYFDHISFTVPFGTASLLFKKVEPILTSDMVYVSP